uniref:Uncharacterized protein n=1 Tax=Lepeophtheirus salmonis TaxID=72036 RepID=A0A0K2UJ93_LEPSM
MVVYIGMVLLGYFSGRKCLNGMYCNTIWSSPLFYIQRSTFCQSTFCPFNVLSVDVLSIHFIPKDTHYKNSF